MFFLKDKIEVFFAGGQSAIGEKNGTIIRVGKYALVIDWGQKIQHVEFTEENGPHNSGDLPDDCYPDMNLLSGLTVLGFCATHGHLDHIGGWHKLYERYPNIPVITSRFTDKVIRMLGERNGSKRFFSSFHDENLQIGPFKIKRFAVNHSIPGSSGFLIEVVDEKGGKVRARIVTTGDFKTWIPWRDDTTGEVHDKNLEVFGKLTDAGAIDILLIDSTNSEQEGWMVSENAVRDTFAGILAKEPGRVFTTTISSNTYRQRLFIEEALKARRKVYVAGRAMRDFLNLEGVSEFTRVIVIPKGKQNGEKQQFDVAPPPEEWADGAVILCTGSQGDPNSFLDKLANGAFGNIYRKGDVLIISQNTIPSDEIEKRFERMIINLSSKIGRFYLPPRTPRNIPSNGAQFTRDNHLHTSGHGTWNDKARLIELLSQRSCPPKSPKIIWVHGGEGIRKIAADRASKLGCEPVLVGDGEKYIL